MSVPHAFVQFRSVVRAVAALAVVTLLCSVQLPVIQASAATVRAVSSARDADTGFPLWFQDALGQRLEPCTDAADAQCVLPGPLDEPGFDPAAPLAFPGNFPTEFFYSVADSEITGTGCNGTTTGKIKLRLGLEGAFANGDPVPNDQMVFGRIRIVVTPGSLCPNTAYTFTHPYGSETITTNADGAVPANAGTEDVGCVPTAGVPCNFAEALNSRLFGGFLHWPAGSDGLPAGYLGDSGVAHEVEGSPTGDNFFRVAVAGGLTVAENDLFSVSGKLAGPLVSSPSSADFGGVEVGSSKALPFDLTNVGTDPLTVSALTLAGVDASEYAVSAGACDGAVLAQDEACQATVTFAPDAAGEPGRRTASLEVGHDGLRSPLNVALTGTATVVGATASLSATPSPVAFGDQRLRVHSGTKTVTITNADTADAPLGVTGVTTSGEAAKEFAVDHDPCTGHFLDPGQSCALTLTFSPAVLGARAATLDIASNDATNPAHLDLSGNGIGGVAKASSDKAFGYPTWYQDENGIRLAECTDGSDPGCILPGAGDEPDFDPAKPASLPGPPLNFPTEFFWTVADSDIIITPGCGGLTPPGKAFIRVGLEGAFNTPTPVDGEQIAFGRIRVVVTSGLCPNHKYDFVNPFGVESFTTNGVGQVTRPAGTEDTGCFPVSPDVCDFDQPLQSRVLSGFLRWDPTVSPQAPGGYIGDGVTPHKVIGGSYVPEGATAPANYFQILDAENGISQGRTDQWTVAGKLAGPLVATPGKVKFAQEAVTHTSAPQTVTLSNEGLSPLTVHTLALQGVNAGDYALTPSGDHCTDALLAAATPATPDIPETPTTPATPGSPATPAGTCTVDLTFSPTDTGTRTAILAVDHTGLNSVLAVPVTGIGGAPAAALNVSPGSLSFAQTKVGRTTTAQTVTVDNIGGSAPLDVTSIDTSGAALASFAVDHETCIGSSVAVGASCTVDVVLDPATAGALTASLDIVSANGLTRHVALTGTGFDGEPGVSAANDADNGFPDFYQDGNGVRVVACLDGADPQCVLPAAGDEPGFDPAQPTTFPSNFPTEFFYWVADSDIVDTPGCAATPAGGVAIPAGRASTRLALEGSSAGDVPAAGDQVTFARIRVTANGLCANTEYTVTHPYGTEKMTTDALGAIRSTDDVGCGPVAPATCAFEDALGSRVAESFLRFDPAFGAAPAGYLGDAVNPHRISGSPTGTNYFSIAGPEVSGLRTDMFTIAGKLGGAGGALADTTAPNVTITAPAAAATVGGTVSVTADATDNVAVTSVQFQRDGVDLGAPDTTAPYAVSWDTTAATGGAHALTAIASDAAGHHTTSAVRNVIVNNTPPAPVLPAAITPTVIDTVSPVASAPADTVPLVAQLPTTGVPVQVTLSATDLGGSLIASFQLQQSINGGPFTTVTPVGATATTVTAFVAATARTVTVLVTPGPATHRFRVRAVDHAGNVGAWVTGKAFRLAVVQDSAHTIRYQGAWKVLKTSTALGGASRHAAAAGSSVSASFKGKQVSWVSSRGPNRGIARVYIDGKRVATVDGYARTTKNRVVVLSRNVSAGRHRIEIRTTHTKNPKASGFGVYVDAFVVVSG